jgi:hypothetical protein
LYGTIKLVKRFSQTITTMGCTTWVHFRYKY